MKRLLIILSAILISINSFAQKQNDVVYLKNGSIIKGNVIEAIPDSTLKIQTNDGSLFVFNMSEISKIGKTEISRNEYSYKSTQGPKQGYTGFVEVAYGVGLNGGDNRVYLRTTHGYQFNPYFFAGLGTAYDFMKGINPIYADFRATLDKKLSPFFDLKFGVNTENNKIYLSPELGCRVGLNRGCAIDIGISFDYVQHKYRTNYSEDSNALVLAVGFEY